MNGKRLAGACLKVKMTSQHLQSSSQIHEGKESSSFTGISGIKFPPPLPPSLSPDFGIMRKAKGTSDLDFKILGPPVSLLQNQSKVWTSEGNRDMNWNGGYLWNQRNGGDEEEKEEEEEEEEEEKELESGVRLVHSRKPNGTKLCSRGHWRPAEDAKLKELVSQLGPQNWNLISEKLNGRSGKSCRLRWFNQLDPRINRRAFSEEEEEKLLAAHRVYGNKWAMIARLFHGRTDNGVKNHWHVIMARKQREQYATGSSSSSSHVNQKRKNLVPFSPPPPPPPPPTTTTTTTTTNVCSVSTIISRDKSPATTSTDLSLISSVITNPHHFHHHHHYELQMGSSEEKILLSFANGYPKFDGSSTSNHSSNGGGHYHPAARGMMTFLGLGLGLGLDQSGYSDSNSEISATESVNNNNKKRKQVCVDGGVIENGSGIKTSLPFIDFLGVGTTT